MLSSLLSLVIILAVIGFGLWLLNTLVPMAAPIKTVLNAVVAIVVFVLVIGWLFGGVSIPHMRLFQ